MNWVNWGLFLVDIEFFVQAVHLKDVDKNKDNKGKNGSLLGKPKPKFKATKSESIQLVDQQDAEAKGDNKPDSYQAQNNFDISSPIVLHALFLIFHGVLLCNPFCNYLKERNILFVLPAHILTINFPGLFERM